MKPVYNNKNYPEKDPMAGLPECFGCDNGHKLYCGETCEHSSHWHKCDGCGRQRYVGVVEVAEVPKSPVPLTREEMIRRKAIEDKLERQRLEELNSLKI